MKAKAGLFIFILLITLSIEDGLASGLIITDVISGSLADRAGLKVGDKILEINGKYAYAIRPFQMEVSSLLRQKTPFSLKVKRGEKILDFYLIPQGENILGITLASSGDFKEGSREIVQPTTKADLNTMLNTYENLKKSNENKKKLLKREIEKLYLKPKDYLDKSKELIQEAQTYGEMELVAQFLEKAKTSFPEEENIYFNLGLIYDALEDYEKAINNLQEFKRRSPYLSLREIEEIDQLINKNKQNLQRLEDIKKRMVSGSLIKIFEVPNYDMPNRGSKRRAPQEEQAFKFVERESEIYLQHPDFHRLSRTFSFWEERKDETLVDRSYQKNVEREPYLRINFKGKRFEVRYLILYIAPPTPEENYYRLIYNWYLIKGNFEFQGESPSLTLTTFRRANYKKLTPGKDIWEEWGKERTLALKTLWEEPFKENLDEFMSEIKYRMQ